MKSKFFAIFLSAFATVILSANAFAQTTGSVNGAVTDPNGAALAGATVTIKSVATGSERTVTSSAQGAYSASQLPPGMYKISVSHAGFKTTQIDSLELAVGQSRTLDLIMQTGEVTAIVDITADEFIAASIDQSSNRLGANISAREVNEMPVNGRNFSQLYLNAPGATNTGSGNFNELRFNGRANQQNQTKLDGIESSAIFDASPGYVTVQGSQFRLQTSIENIQEFRVDSSNYPAEYGTGTGGQINVIGKSGGNQYRGSLFYYGRNDVFDARNFFDGADKSALRLNQFGGSFGGPIIKDKLFFFGSFEGLRQRAGFNVIETTLSERGRDFVNYYGTADPRGEAARIALGIPVLTAADDARVAALRATGVVNVFPVGFGSLINIGGLTGVGQVVQVNRSAQLDENAYSGRVDWKVNDKLTIYGRYQRNDGKLLSPDGASGRFVQANQNPDNLVISATQVFDNGIVNEAKFGFNRAPTDLTTIVPETSGLNGFDLSLTSLRVSGNIVSPGINGGATTGFTEPGGLTRQSSAANGRAQPIRPTSYSYIDNLSVTKGNHNFKFGGEFRQLRVDFDQLGGITYSYANLNDFILNRNLTAAFTGDLSLSGDFRVATDPISTVSRPFTDLSRGRQFYAIGYAQDEWRVRPEVVLSYGLRYEYYSVNREVNDRAVVFDPQVGGLVDPGSDFYKVTHNFGPRFGVTWAPKFLGGKTVIRGGGGLYFGPGQYEDLIQPIESNVFRSSQTIANGLTTGIGAAVSTIGGIQSRFTPRAYDRANYQVPERVFQYGVSVQHQLPGDTVLTVAYVGSQGRNLFLRSITNRILSGSAVIQNSTALPTGVGVITRCATAPVNGTCAGAISGTTVVREFDTIGRRLDTGTGTIVNDPLSVLQPFGEIDYKTSGGEDHYNALQVLINRRFAKGLTLNAQYQFGKSVGNTQGSNEANTAQDPFTFEDEIGQNTFDIRHSANITALYELPFGKGKHWNLDGVADALLGGWQIGGVYNGRSGTPINVTTVRPDTVFICNQASCTLPTGNVSQGFVIGSLPTSGYAGFISVINTPGGNASRSTRRPDLIPGANPYIQGANGLQFLNPAAFATPAPGTYGNLPRNFLKGPVFHQFDLTLKKKFRITETVNFEFRSELYNILNRANFANPPSVLPQTLTNTAASVQPGVAYATGNTGTFGFQNATVGRTVGLGTNRQIQFALRLNF